MKNGKVEAAKAFLKSRGHDDIPDQDIIDLFKAVKDKNAAIYEVDDFVEVYFGMGEMGHGTVKSLTPNGYRVEIWAPEGEEKFVYTQGVGQGDMRGLSTPEKALEYWKERSK